MTISGGGWNTLFPTAAPGGYERKKGGTFTRAGGMGFHGNCGGHHDRHRNFSEARGDGARGPQRVHRVRRVDCGRGSFAFRCAFVRRVGRGDSRSGWRVRLLAARARRYVGISIWLDALDCGAAVVAVFHCGGDDAVHGIFYSGGGNSHFHLAHRDSGTDWMAETLRLCFYLGPATWRFLAGADDGRELSWRAAGRRRTGFSDSDQTFRCVDVDWRGVSAAGCWSACATAD